MAAFMQGAYSNAECGNMIRTYQVTGNHELESFETEKTTKTENKKKRKDKKKTSLLGPKPKKWKAPQDVNIQLKFSVSQQSQQQLCGGGKAILFSRQRGIPPSHEVQMYARRHSQIRTSVRFPHGFNVYQGSTFSTKLSVPSLTACRAVLGFSLAQNNRPFLLLYDVPDHRRGSSRVSPKNSPFLRSASGWNVKYKTADLCDLQSLEPQ